MVVDPYSGHICKKMRFSTSHWQICKLKSNWSNACSTVWSLAYSHMYWCSASENNIGKPNGDVVLTCSCSSAHRTQRDMAPCRIFPCNLVCRCRSHLPGCTSHARTDSSVHSLGPTDGHGIGIGQ